MFVASSQAQCRRSLHHVRVLSYRHARHMSFWSDFKDQFKQQYNNNDKLKESVGTFKQTAESVSQTSSKITNKAKGTLGTVSEKIKVAVPYSPDSTKLKEGAGKASEVLKKALDFLGNNLTFLKTESKIPQRSQNAAKGEAPAAGKQQTTTPTTPTPATGPSDNVKQETTTEKPRGPPLMTKTPSPTVKTVPPLENPEEAPGGGTALTIVPTSEWEKYWQKIGGDAASEIGQKLNARVGSFVNRILPETTIASTISKIKETNSDFTLHSFLHELQEFVPLVMECLLLADVKGMKPLASEKMYRMFLDIVRSSTTRGTFQDSKLLDVGQIELWDAKMDENNRPSFIITFNIQFIYTIRDRSGKIIEGAEDDIKSSHYIMLITPDPSETTWVCHEVMQQSLSSYL